MQQAIKHGGSQELGWPRFDGKLWQRNYYEHIIRNADEAKQSPGLPGDCFVAKNAPRNDNYAKM